MDVLPSRIVLCSYRRAGVSVAVFALCVPMTKVGNADDEDPGFGHGSSGSHSGEDMMALCDSGPVDTAQSAQATSGPVGAAQWTVISGPVGVITGTVISGPVAGGRDQ